MSLSNFIRPYVNIMSKTIPFVKCILSRIYIIYFHYNKPSSKDCSSVWAVFRLTFNIKKFSVTI